MVVCVLLSPIARAIALRALIRRQRRAWRAQAALALAARRLAQLGHAAAGECVARAPLDAAWRRRALLTLALDASDVSYRRALLRRAVELPVAEPAPGRRLAVSLDSASLAPFDVPAYARARLDSLVGAPTVAAGWQDEDAVECGEYVDEREFVLDVYRELAGAPQTESAVRDVLSAEMASTDGRLLVSLFANLDDDWHDAIDNEAQPIVTGEFFATLIICFLKQIRFF